VAVQRNNILADEWAKRDYIEGVLALKREATPGEELIGNTYDKYVYWHYRAMMTLTPSPPLQNPDGRNAAHTGPVFCPWHRMLLSRLEQDIQRVLGKPDFGLPYWDWAADGETEDPGDSDVWADDCMGPAGGPVASGPFRFDEENPNDPDNWRVRISDDIFQAGPTIRLLNRGLYRALRTTTMPTGDKVREELRKTAYDVAPWGFFGETSFRRGLEVPLHNTVHRWVRGDMVTSCSPNDPVFFLHHCNVDRIWASWQKQHDFPPYVPDETAGDDLKWHRVHDLMFPIKGNDPEVRVRDVLDFEERFEYDRYESLSVEDGG
jgi:tyrosinase